MLRATTACTFPTSQLPKALRTWGVFSFSTCKRASRHKGMHFFDISTSKSGLNVVCFVHFDFDMCFAPQRRTLFRRVNFQKCSEPGVLCTFWLRNVLRATTACTFSTSQLLKALWSWNVCIFWLRNVLRATTACDFSSLIWPDCSAPAALATYFSTLRSHKSLEKHSVSRLSYLSRTWILLSSDCLFFDPLSSSLLFSYSSHLCFSSVHIVGSLTSKLPSTSWIFHNICGWQVKIQFRPSELSLQPARRSSQNGEARPPKRCSLGL